MEVIIKLNYSELRTVVENGTLMQMGETLNKAALEKENAPAPIENEPQPATEDEAAASAQEELKPEPPKEASKKEEAPEFEKINVQLEDVRKVLADLSRGGKAAEAKNLISKFGVGKLTDVPKEHYPELLMLAKEIA